MAGRNKHNNDNSFKNEQIGYIVSIAVSDKKGMQKKRVNHATLIENFGIEGDAHAGKWHRQVSFLASERIEEQSQKGFDVDFGSYAENIATKGIDWPSVPIGTQVEIGQGDALIEITQIGKKCHTKCAIYNMAGDCIMPRQGVFGRVIKGGKISVGDTLRLLDKYKNDKNN